MNRRRFLGWSLAGWDRLPFSRAYRPPAIREGSAHVAPASSQGEMLYNGIRLPSPWPPAVAWDDIKGRKPLPEPPYLQSPPAVIPIDVGRQLFVDDFLIAQTTLDAHLSSRRSIIAHNPVFTGGMVFSDGVWYDPKDQLFKMWYHANGARLYDLEGRPPLGSRADSGAERADRLADGLARPRGEGPARRFKMFARPVPNNDSRGLWVHFSADGIHWRHGGRPVPAATAARSSTTRSARSGSTASARLGPAAPPRYWEVTDLVKGPQWRQPGQPAEPSCGPAPTSSTRSEPDYKVTPPAVQPRLRRLREPAAGPVHDLARAARTAPEAQRGLRRLQPRRLHWPRPDRRPFCPVSENKGDWNYGNVQSAGGCCLVVGDQLYFYVSGRGKGNVTSLATLRRDGFASIDADEAGGYADHAAGQLPRQAPLRQRRRRAGSCAPRSSTRAGGRSRRSHAEIRPRLRDRTLQAVRWQGAQNLSAVAGKPVKLRFFLKNGSLYAFWVSPEASGASHGYVAAGGPGFAGPTDTVGRDAGASPARRL